MKHFQFFGAFIAFHLLLAVSCGQNIESARRELANLHVAYTTEAFVKAAESGDLVAVRLFLEAGMSPDVVKATDGTTPLLIAVLRGHTNVAATLLARNASVDLGDKEKTTPLMVAAAVGDSNLVNLLISKGANISSTDRYGTTPLMMAASDGSIPIIQTLLAKGANIAATNSDGRTVLMHAVNKARIPAIKFLVKRGAQLSQEDSDGKTAYDFALENKPKDGANTLRELGARANSKFSVSLVKQNVAESIRRITVQEAQELEKTNGQKEDPFKQSKTAIKTFIAYCEGEDFSLESKGAVFLTMIEALGKAKFSVAVNRSSFDDPTVTKSVNAQIDKLMLETISQYEKSTGKTFQRKR